ncbi:MAG: hypothetical protein M1813_008550 [Trichoglossum hirsutum]|nr:MAG: hypothetical protein M1813_008550 [Trichoglossum hirsutum]
MFSSPSFVAFRELCNEAFKMKRPVLLHPSNNLLLISTPKSDTVWDIDAKAETTDLSYTSRAPSAAAIEGDGVKNVVQSPLSHTVAVESSKLYGERATTRMLFFEATNFCSEAGELIPIHEFQDIGQRVLHLIGPYGSKMVFLDRDLWVCSVDMSKSEGEKHTYIRHFSIPSDWYSQQRNLNTIITSKGDILFVKMEEVAVIKRGLEFEDVVTISLD